MFTGEGEVMTWQSWHCERAEGVRGGRAGCLGAPRTTIHSLSSRPRGHPEFTTWGRGVLLYANRRALNNADATRLQTSPPDRRDDEGPPLTGGEGEVVMCEEMWCDGYV